MRVGGFDLGLEAQGNTGTLDGLPDAVYRTVHCVSAGHTVVGGLAEKNGAGSRCKWAVDHPLGELCLEWA